jgi:hypothetical protein
LKKGRGMDWEGRKKQMIVKDKKRVLREKESMTGKRNP